MTVVSRRSPLLRAASCLALALASRAVIAEPGPALAVASLGDGAYVYYGAQEDASPRNGGAIANLGFVVGTRCVAVIDTGGTPAEGARLRAAVRSATDLPICAVINTHMHPDHVYGNSAFVADHVPFIGHVHLGPALAARSISYAKALERTLGDQAHDAQLVLPTQNVTPGQPLSLDLGGRVLTVRAWRTAHTDNDLTVFDERSGTLWAGDLLFAERVPALDGSITGWLVVMDQIEKLNPRRVIPGHGPLGDWHAQFAAQRHYLRTLAEGTRAAIRAHHPIAQAVEEVGGQEHGHWLLYDEYHRRNVTAAYAELEWEQ